MEELDNDQCKEGDRIRSLQITTNKLSTPLFQKSAAAYCVVVDKKFYYNDYNKKF